MLLSVRSTFERLLSYFCAVTVGFTADVLVFLALSNLGWPILPANALGFLIGASVNVLLIRRLVFRGTPVPRHMDLLVTITSNVAIMLLGTLIIWTLSLQFGLSLFTAKIVASGCTLILNFAVRTLLERYWPCSQISRKKP
ncbi:GtrA family protein [Ruegeria arenilitoris]|uniref:GtrA family protein n=1 Tax=Ruegeria arenilitoris TaxID=1173585 RepID=UPI00148073B9